VGQEASSNIYSQEEFDKFEKNLKDELKLLKTWFDDDIFSKNDPMIGAELEGWIVDENMLPSFDGYDHIQSFKHPLVVPEISRFNFEFNSSPLNYTKNCFRELQDETHRIYQKFAKATKKDTPFFCGTLPTLRPSMLSNDIMTPHNRYSVMNEQVMKQRNYIPLDLSFEGKDELKLSMNSVISECASTSLQIHLGVTNQNAANYYNCSLIASSFLVAISANSPYFFGKELWDESRIIGFEKSVDLNSKSKIFGDDVKRVTLGHGFVEESLFELYEQNVYDYPILLPECFDCKVGDMKHLAFHNGTIWRWTRPIIGIYDGIPSLRIEQRVASSGPTIDDTIANTMFFLGLVDYLNSYSSHIKDSIEFKDVKENFYKAAKQSYYAKCIWVDGKSYDTQKLLLDVIVPAVKDALKKRNINQEDIDYFIGDIIQGRVKSGVNGAIWQKAYVHRYGTRFQELTQKYIDNAKSGLPVHLWEL
jgi:hypothetical protein